MSIHIVPLRDERIHDLTTECWCEPRTEGQGQRVIHNAADCREVSERVTGESVEAGKEWQLLDEDGEAVG